MTTCGCRPGSPPSPACPEGQRLQASETLALQTWATMLARREGDPDREFHARRLREIRDRIAAHTSGEGSENDSYARDERLGMQMEG